MSSLRIIYVNRTLEISGRYVSECYIWGMSSIVNLSLVVNLFPLHIALSWEGCLKRVISGSFLVHNIIACCLELGSCFFHQKILSRSRKWYDLYSDNLWVLALFDAKFSAIF